MDKPHILALATETGFLRFKKQVLLKFKKEISAVQCERKTFRLVSLSTPVNFRWTVPLSGILLADNFGQNTFNVSSRASTILLWHNKTILIIYVVKTN